MKKILVLTLILNLILNIGFCSGLPVKATDSLGDFTDIHKQLGYSVILSQVRSLVEKYKKLEDSANILQKLSSDQKLLKETKKEFKRLLEKDEEFTKDCGKNFDFENNFNQHIDSYGKYFLNKSINDILAGNYDNMFSTLPKVYDSPVFNTFACAFSFIHEDGSKSDIFLDDDDISSAILPKYSVPENVIFIDNNLVFISGESKKVLTPIAIQVQASSLGGSMPQEIFGEKVAGLESAFRHSEQKAFVMLYGPQIVKYLRNKLHDSPPIKEIVFHGCTLRDMCSNCCATLTSHEILAYTSELGHEVKQESFLVYLQNSFSSGPKIPITSIVSSLIRYYHVGEEPISWNLRAHTSLVDQNAVTETGITCRFVNQFRLAEQFFLETFVSVFQGQIPIGPGAGYCTKILDAILDRLREVIILDCSFKSTIYKHFFRWNYLHFYNRHNPYIKNYYVPAVAPDVMAAMRIAEMEYDYKKQNISNDDSCYDGHATEERESSTPTTPTSETESDDKKLDISDYESCHDGYVTEEMESSTPATPTLETESDDKKLDISNDDSCYDGHATEEMESGTPATPTLEVESDDKKLDISDYESCYDGYATEEMESSTPATPASETESDDKKYNLCEDKDFYPFLFQ